MILLGVGVFPLSLAPRLIGQTLPQMSPQQCVGDCGADGSVSVDDLVAMANIALGSLPLATCAAGDANQDGRVTIDEVIAAVRNALDGCSPAAVALHGAVHFDQRREPINERLLGTVQPGPLPDDNRLLKEMVGPPDMRVDVGFEDSGCPNDPLSGPLYDAADNSFNYCQLDARLQQAQAAGSAPLLIIDYMPPLLAAPACAATNGRGFGADRCPPADYAAYGALVEAMIRHTYTTFGVTDFEVWNEPDWTFFAGTLSDYLHLYETCSAALVRAETGLGLPPRSLHLGGPAAFLADRSWINGLLSAAVSAPELRVDFISWHSYADNPLGPQPDPFLYAGTYADQTQKVRGWVTPFTTQRPDLQPALWIDEWNVNAFYDSRMDTSYDAAFTVAALHAMQDAGLDRAARFNTWDSTPASPEGFNGNWGLFTNDGMVRPGFYALAMWRQLEPIRVAVDLLDSASQMRDMSSRTRYAQNLVASIDPSSGIATVLLYNFVPYSSLDASPPYCGGGVDLEANLDLVGLADGTYDVVRQEVDCGTPIQPVQSAALATQSSSLTVAGSQATVAITAPADGVLLLTLRPVRGSAARQRAPLAGHRRK